MNEVSKDLQLEVESHSTWKHSFWHFLSENQGILTLEIADYQIACDKQHLTNTKIGLDFKKSCYSF